MAVKIRLKKIGRKNRPFYRICVFDGRTRRDGRPIEELGSYDPRAETFDKKVTLKCARAHYWLGVGAQPSETVASILRKAKVFKTGPVPEADFPPQAELAEVAADGGEVPAAATADEAPAAEAASSDTDSTEG